MRDELRVAATMANMRQVCDFVRERATRLGLDEDVVFDIDVAVEEAATNIARHAYESGRAGDVQVGIEVTDREVRLALTDWGKPFEADAAHLAVDVPPELRAEGGMGVLLIEELMDEVARTTSATPGGPNVLTMVKHIGR